MSPTIAHQLRSSGKVVPVNGDIEKPNVGLCQSDLQQIQQQVNFIIHSASSLNLKAKLARLMPSVVEASLTMTNLALTCPHLDRFVYISTAYANANRHDPFRAEETFIEEKIYPLTADDAFASAIEELSEARQNGQVLASQSFPFTYGYAKHLTERLITNAFKDSPVRRCAYELLPPILMIPGKTVNSPPIDHRTSRTESIPRLRCSRKFPNNIIRCRTVRRSELDIQSCLAFRELRLRDLFR